MASQEIILKVVYGGDTTSGKGESKGKSPKDLLSSLALGIGGKAGMAAVAINQGLEIIKKVWHVLEGIYRQASESSKSLKAVNEIFGLAWKLAFKPLGDFLGMILKPLAVFLLKWVVGDLKEYQARKQFYKGLGELGESLSEKGGVSGVIGKMFEGLAGIGETGILPVEVGLFISALVGSLHDLGLFIKDALDPTYSAEDVVKDSIMIPLTSLYQDYKTTMENKSGEVETEITKFYDSEKSEIQKKEELIPTWVNDGLEKPMTSFFDTLKNSFPKAPLMSSGFTGDPNLDFIGGELNGKKFGNTLSEKFKSFDTGFVKIFDDFKSKQETFQSTVPSLIYKGTEKPNKTLFELIGFNTNNFKATVPSLIQKNEVIPTNSLFGNIKTNTDSFTKSIPNIAKTNVSNPITSLMKAIKNAIDSAKAKIRDIESSGSRGGLFNVNDAIITPKGDIIRTNSEDYLIATKHPESLGGGGGPSIQTMNVNISVQELNSDMQIRQLAQKVSESIQRQMSYRTAGGY